MTLPTITEDCLVAQISKMTQKPQEEFAAEIMTELLDEQPCAMAAVISLLEPFLKPQPNIETVELAVAQEVILQASFTVLGVLFRTLKAQDEADEMNEHWG